MFDVLRGIGVGLTRYHGGSFNGKDIKTFTDNATYVFDQWSQILQDGRRGGCAMSKEKIDERCQQYKSVFLLWDRATSFARKINPSEEDRTMFRRFVDAAVDGHCSLGCNITHNVHLMWKHVEW